MNHPDFAAQDERFRRLAVTFVGVTLMLALVIPWIPVPEVERAVHEDPLRRVAEIVLERRLRPVVPEPEVRPPRETPPPATPAPPEVAVAPAPQTVRQAQEKASVAGLLAFRDQLAALRDTVDTAILQDTASIQRGAGEAAKLDRSLIASRSGSRLAGVNTAALSRDIGGIAVAGRETTRVEAPEDEVADAGARRLVAETPDAVRSIEEIRRVFDENKGAIYAIYNRALRRDPTLLGKVVLELVIEPSGRVSGCDVVSSDLADEEMLVKILRRVQLFDFGQRDVGVTRISYPVHFLPS